MATIKINYGGTDYSMIKTPTKITTPSVKVDDGYIPCFKGDRFSEVLNGNYYYTLSPIKVGDYRMACGSRPAFTENDRVYVNIWWSSFSVPMGFLVLTNYSCSIGGAFTSKSGFSATITCNNPSQSVGSSAASSYTFYFSGTYTVRDTNTGDIVKTGNYSFGKSVSWGYENGSGSQVIA